MLGLAVTFLTPLGGLIALAVLMPAVALAEASRRRTRARRILGLAAPRRDTVGIAALALVPLLLGLAATQPAIRRTRTRDYRTHAEALFVIDVSGSMGAASGPTAPDRLSQAKVAAIRLRNVIADVPSGVATLTTQILPQLLPTRDVATFDSTVQRVIAVEKPPPPTVAYGTLGTSFEPLTSLRKSGYFAPDADRRLVVLLSDGESGPYNPETTAAGLTGSTVVTAPEQSRNIFGAPATTLPPSGLQQSAPSLALVIVRVGSPTDRLFEPDGSVDAAYQPEADADAIVANLAALAHGGAYSASTSLGAAAREMRRLVGRGRARAAGTTTTTVGIARYIALAALLLTALALWRRNATRRSRPRTRIARLRTHG
ncbi:MAG TPA: hypothetical protein VGN06_11360 [Gaiellaceae bacterium]